MAQTYLTFVDVAKLINLTYTGRQNIARRQSVAEAFDKICDKFKYYGINIDTESNSEHDKYNRDRMINIDPQLSAIIDKRWCKARTITTANADLIPFIAERPNESVKDKFVVHTELHLYKDKNYRDIVRDKKMSPIPSAIIENHRRVIDSILEGYGLKSEIRLYSHTVGLEIIDTDRHNFHIYGVIDIQLETIFAPGRRFSLEKLAEMSDVDYTRQMKKLTTRVGSTQTDFFTAPTSLFD